MFKAACNLAVFGFLRSVDFTVPNLAGFSSAIHLGVTNRWFRYISFVSRYRSGSRLLKQLYSISCTWGRASILLVQPFFLICRCFCFVLDGNYPVSYCLHGCEASYPQLAFNAIFPELIGTASQAIRSKIWGVGRTPIIHSHSCGFRSNSCV